MKRTLSSDQRGAHTPHNTYTCTCTQTYVCHCAYIHTHTLCKHLHNDTAHTANKHLHRERDTQCGLKTNFWEFYCYVRNSNMQARRAGSNMVLWHKYNWIEVSLPTLSWKPNKKWNFILPYRNSAKNLDNALWPLSTTSWGGNTILGWPNRLL